MSSGLRRPPTHFICLPLCTPASLPKLVLSLQAFKKRAETLLCVDVDEPGDGAKAEDGSTKPVEVKEVSQSRDSNAESFNRRHARIIDKMFRPPGALHFTLGVMNLEDSERMNRTKQLLQNLDIESIFAQLGSNDPDFGSNPLAPFKTSLESLHALPSKTNTRVLYTAPPETASTLQLQAMSEALREPFIEAGLLDDEKRPLLLHATIFNTIYGSGRGKRKGGRKEKLQTSQLISDMSAFTFADEIRIDRVALCPMGAKPVEDEEGLKYVELVTRMLPTIPTQGDELKSSNDNGSMDGRAAEDSIADTQCL